MLLKSSNKFVLVFFLGLLGGCFSGSEKTKVGSSDYYFINLGGYQRFLIDDKDSIVVPPAIIGYIEYDGGFVFVRQITKEFTCDSGTLRTKILDEFEYWDLYRDTKYKLAGPFQKETLKSSIGERDRSKIWWEMLGSKVDALEHGSKFLSSGNDCG